MFFCVCSVFSRFLPKTFIEFNSIGDSFVGVTVNVKACLSQCGPVRSWRLAQVVTLPPPCECWEGLQLTPMTLCSGTSIYGGKSMNDFFLTAAPRPATLCGERRHVLPPGPDRHLQRQTELLPDRDPHYIRQAH